MKRFALSLLMLGAGSARGAVIDVTEKTLGRNLVHNLSSVVYDDALHTFVVDGGVVERVNLSRELRSLSSAEVMTLARADSYFVVSRDSDMDLHVESFLRVRGGVYGDDMDDDDYAVTARQHGDFAQQNAGLAVAGCANTLTSQAVQGNIKSLGDVARKCAAGAAGAVVGKTVFDVANGNTTSNSKK